LGNQFFELGDLWVFLLRRFIVLLASFLGLLPSLLFLLLFLRPLLLFQIFQLLLDGLLVQDTIEPLLLLTCEHEDHFWQFPGLA
jgi:hypothetical protein